MTFAVLKDEPTINIMKHYFILAFALFSVHILFAQSPTLAQATLTGTVVESKTNNPLEYATIVLRNTKTNKVDGGITDAKGKFSIQVPKGEYIVSFEFISFKTITLPKQNITSDKDFGTIKLVEDSFTLNEISIVAEKSTVEIRLDKRIYNVGKDMTVKGGTASDVLDNVPSVDVDVEGNVSLRGNENVRILIDGKPSALVGLNGVDALRQLPADAIERVEVITSPSARYDAEGTAGILNIILRKGKAVGFNGALNVSVGDPKSTQLSTNLNLRTKKYNLFSNIGYNDRGGPGNSNTFLTYLTNGVIDSTRNEDRRWTRLRSGYNANIGLEVFLNKKSSITGSIFFRDSDGANPSINTINSFDITGDVLRNSVRIQDETEIDRSTQYSLNYTNNFNDKGHKLTLDFQYSESEENQNTLIREQSNTENNTTDEESKNTLIQADYVLPIGENQQFEAGYRGNFEDLNSNYLVDAPNLDPQFNPSNNLEFKQDVHAFYTQYGSKIDKLSFLLGLRSETTIARIRLLNTNDNYDKKFTELFPTVNLGYELSDAQSFTLGYSRRLRRPRSWFLNPFESRNSETFISKGNPDLLPTFTNSFDLGYLNRFNKVILNSSIYYQRSTNNIERVNRQETRTINGIPTNVIIREPINLSAEDRYGFELTANYSASRKVKLSSTFNYFRFKTSGEYTYTANGESVTQFFDNENSSWFTRFNARITLPANIEWQTRLFYRGPRNTAQSFNKGIFSANLAFSKDLFKEKGSLVLNISDLFNSRKSNSTTYSPSVENPTNISQGTFQWRQRQISLNFTYRFNQKKKMDRGGRPNQDYDGGGEEFGV